MIDCILIPTVRKEWSALIDLLSNFPSPSVYNCKINLVISIDEQWQEEEKQFIKQVISQSPSKNAFNKIYFISCQIPEKDSVYYHTIPDNWHENKLAYGLKSGPNLLFFLSLQQIIKNQFCNNALLLMETDLLPLTIDWLDELNEEIRREENFLIAGSRYLGESNLEKSILNHINGNAVYHLGHQNFEEFLSLWESLLVEVIHYNPNIAYDIAIEYIMANKSQFISDLDIINKIDTIETYYKTGATFLRGIVNFSGAHENNSNYNFSVNDTLNRFPYCVLLHCKAALPYKRRLWAKYISGNAIIDKSIIGYDKHWQYPAITEQHAFHQVQKRLTFTPNVIYFAFPWATLIDTAIHNKNKLYKFRKLAYSFKPLLHRYHRVYTVCQHIYMEKFLKNFSDLGITDIFWSHALKNSSDKYYKINIHPFPLYPVHFNTTPNPLNSRKYLFSFVGAKPIEDLYLTNSRNWVLDFLSDYPQGYVKPREQWHYYNIVYENQIKKNDQHALTDKQNEKEYTEILSQSIFSLCPSGSGPNTIRLWESIGSGCIPVVLSDNWQPPGDISIWNDAVLFIKETQQAINELPDRLNKIKAEPAILSNKQEALKILWEKYGPENFIYDITEQLKKSEKEHPISGSKLLKIAKNIKESNGISRQKNNFFTLTCKTRIKLNKEKFKQQYNEQYEISNAMHIALNNVDINIKKEILKLLNELESSKNNVDHS